MFEIQGKYGFIIDENVFNVGLVHTHILKPPDRTSRLDDFTFQSEISFGSDNRFGFVWDIPIPDFVKYPIVGISFKYGVGYAQLSFKQGNKRIARVFIAIHKELFLKYYPQYNRNKTNADLLFDVCTKEPFKVLFFDTNPLIRQTGLGLEIFNKDGELIYDSDLPTLTFPKDMFENADNYRTIIICKIFFPFGYYADMGNPDIPVFMLQDKKRNPSLFMFDKKGGLGEAIRVLDGIDKKYISHLPEFITRYSTHNEEFYGFNCCMLATY